MTPPGLVDYLRSDVLAMGASEIESDSSVDVYVDANMIKGKEYGSSIVMLLEAVVKNDLKKHVSGSVSDSNSTSNVTNLYQGDTGDLLRSIRRTKTATNLSSTLRILIAIWLHKGVVYRTLRVLMR